MPLLRISLSYRGRSLAATGLVDSGASVSVLPYYIGHALGAVWDEELRPFPLTGSFGTTDALALRVMARHPQLAAGNPIELAFAWTRSNSFPILFGQMNFFFEFNICFYRSQEYFDVQLGSTEQ